MKKIMQRIKNVINDAAKRLLGCEPHELPTIIARMIDEDRELRQAVREAREYYAKPENQGWLEEYCIETVTVRDGDREVIAYKR
jgi:hypothetical protein